MELARTSKKAYVCYGKKVSFVWPTVRSMLTAHTDKILSEDERARWNVGKSSQHKDQEKILKVQGF